MHALSAAVANFSINDWSANFIKRNRIVRTFVVALGTAPRSKGYACVVDFRNTQHKALAFVRSKGVRRTSINTLIAKIAITVKIVHDRRAKACQSG